MHFVVIDIGTARIGQRRVKRPTKASPRHPHRRSSSCGFVVAPGALAEPAASRRYRIVRPERAGPGSRPEASTPPVDAGLAQAGGPHGSCQAILPPPG